MEPDLLKPTEAAKLLRVNVGQVYRWIMAGLLPSQRTPTKRGLGHLRIERADVLALLQPVRRKPVLQVETARQAAERRKETRQTLAEFGL